MSEIVGFYSGPSLGLSKPPASLFVLSGEEHTLPSAEIRALVKTYSRVSECSQQGKRIILSTLSDPTIIETITKRAAYCRFGGVLVSFSGGLNSLAVSLNLDLSEYNKSFAVSSQTVSKAECGNLGAAIKNKTKGRVSLENPDSVFQVEKIPEGYVIGMCTTGFKHFSWKERRPRARKFFLPSAIYPKLARLLVNLSGIKENELFLDPFCGTGSLLIESSLMGMRTVGMDITRWIARGALMNLKVFSSQAESIMRADSTEFLPLREIDGVATDVPYGRASSTKGRETGKIISEFTKLLANSMHSTVSRWKYCVIMHPAQVELDFDRRSFELEEQHSIYVHRNLTRAISILRRI